MRHSASRRGLRPLSLVELRHVTGGNNAGNDLAAAFKQLNTTLHPVETATIAASNNNADVIKAFNTINAVGAAVENGAVAVVNAL